MSVTILRGHVLDRLRELPDESVHCAVTSPPYYGLRSYLPDGHQDKPLEIGLEPKLDEYLAKMVEVFREVRRVLRSDGTLWLNIGDSYAGPWGAQGRQGDTGQMAGRSVAAARVRSEISAAQIAAHPKRESNTGSIRDEGLKPKDLMMVPERLALALQADGWWVRARIIWAKKSAMPESVRDRPTKSHEHIWLLSKSESYFYDQVAASEPVAGDPDHPRNRWDTRDEEIPGQKPQKRTSRSGNKERKPASARGVPVDADGSTNGAVAGSIPWEGSTRNWRDVWHLGPEPFKEAHFATFPTEIPRRAIVAGTSEKGCCPSCGAGWVRREEVVGRQVTDAMRYAGGNENGEYHGQAVKEYEGTGAQNASDTKRRILERMSEIRASTWSPSCSCPPAEPVPATVLDPFLGSGTTALVADRLQRDCIGIELNPEYAAMAERRIRADSPLFSVVA